MCESEKAAEEDEVSLEKEIRESDWIVKEVNILFLHVKVPIPMERMEVEWVSEGDEVRIISLRLSDPVDVTVTSGDASETLNVMVKEVRMSWAEMDSWNLSFIISYVVDDVNRE